MLITDQAYVTLATSDDYVQGALVLGCSLREHRTTRILVVLISPMVTARHRSALDCVFDEVIEVDVMDSKDSAHLALLGRPELGVTFTKLHSWCLVQYSKCVFMDADTLVLDNIDDLFEREELSAAPDSGWPDCFNSGVFVYRPSMDTYNRLLHFAMEFGSFDGGDQGLLNSFFREWATQDIHKHLPFLYNLSSNAVYSYLAAYKMFGAQAKVIHFLGPVKPWHYTYIPNTHRVLQDTGTPNDSHLVDILQMWWDIYFSSVIRLFTEPEEGCNVLPVWPKSQESLDVNWHDVGYLQVKRASTLSMASIQECPRLEDPISPARRDQLHQMDQGEMSNVQCPVEEDSKMEFKPEITRGRELDPSGWSPPIGWRSLDMSDFDTLVSSSQFTEPTSKSSKEPGKPKITRPPSAKSRLGGFSSRKNRQQCDGACHDITTDKEPEINCSREAEPNGSSPDPIGWRALDVSDFDTPVSNSRDSESTKWSSAEPGHNKGGGLSQDKSGHIPSNPSKHRKRHDNASARKDPANSDPGSSETSSSETPSDPTSKSVPVKLLKPLFPPDGNNTAPKLLKSNSTRPSSEKSVLRATSPPKIKKRYDSAPVKKEPGTKQAPEKPLPSLSSPLKQGHGQDDGPIKKDILDSGTEISSSQEIDLTQEAETVKAKRPPAKAGASASSPLKAQKRYETKSVKKEPIDHKPEITRNREPEPTETLDQGKANRTPAKLGASASSPLKTKKRFETKSVKKEPVDNKPEVTSLQEPKLTENTEQQVIGKNTRLAAGKSSQNASSPSKPQKLPKGTSVKQETSAIESDPESSTASEAEPVQHPNAELTSVRKLQPIKLLAPLHPPESNATLSKEMWPVIPYQLPSVVGQFDSVKLLAPLFPSDLVGKTFKDLNIKVQQAQSSAEQPKSEDVSRRKWEEGHIDYLGKDAFSNIQKKLDQFLH